MLLKSFFYTKNFYFLKGYLKETVDENYYKNYKKHSYLTFKFISKKYPFTKIGNLSNYYTGIVYFKLGKYKKSIKYLKKFKTNSKTIFSIKYSIIADSYFKLKKYNKAIKYYLLSSSKKNFYSTLFYYRLAFIFLFKKDYKNSYKYLLKIKKLQQKKGYYHVIDNKKLKKYLTLTKIKNYYYLQ
ncbi:tetratricopeptide repeat protein [Candidatus Shikimatogenerans silvanidophilus]|uniref:tetratricopeptide repeat protein n=1 Tax=Candidatus Shikimatogenerans silvanidophilus TaxID=2782547 RepID=UPI001BA86F57|nr:CDC27 family protein [Candidatus Shikimatogenerans silvanidophilus]